MPMMAVMSLSAMIGNCMLHACFMSAALKDVNVQANSSDLAALQRGYAQWICCVSSAQSIEDHLHVKGLRRAPDGGHSCHMVCISGCMIHTI